MPQIKFGENGEVLDSQTGDVIGKMENGSLVLNGSNNKKEDVVVSQNGAKDENTSVAIASDENVVKPPLNAHTIRSTCPSSFITKKTKYEVTPDSFFTVSFGVYEKDGRFIILKPEAVDDIFQAESCWVKFRMWNYDEELSWKNASTEFNFESKSQFLNQNKLNEKKIKNLLLDWSFAESNDRLKLLHTDGILSDESYKIFKGLFPSIANSIIDLMNLVLEQNQ